MNKNFNETEFMACFSCSLHGKQNALCGIIVCKDDDNNNNFTIHYTIVDNDNFKKDLSAQLRNEENIILCCPSFPDIRIVMPGYSQLNVQNVREMFKEIRDIVKRKNKEFNFNIKANPIQS